MQWLNNSGTILAQLGRARPQISRAFTAPADLRPNSGALNMLRATGDIRKVALWLGHASVRTTETYLQVDPTQKIAALAAAIPPSLRPGKFRPSDKLIAMLRQQ